MPRSLVGFAAAAAVAVLACATPASAAGTSALHLTRPKAEMANFNYAEIKGNLQAEPSLFGLPNYQAEKIGRLKFPDTTSSVANPSGENVEGCDPYTNAWAEKPSGETSPQPLIAFVKRGVCSFGQKALMAQNAGAMALVVYNHESLKIGESLPKLAGGDLTASLTIPGMITTKENGDKLIEIMGNNPDKVYMSLVYSVIAPDDSVEYDFFTYPDEVHAQDFLPELGQIAKALEGRSTFTPHFRIMDGKVNGCAVDEATCKANDLPCGSQCTNCGKYCRLDPNGDLDKAPNGEDQVREIARSKCVWKFGHEVADLPHLWHDYNTKRIEMGCVYKKPTDPKSGENYDENCNKAAARAIGVTDSFLDLCMNGKSTLELLEPREHDLMEAELKWISDWQPLTSPYLFVNGFTYFGSFSCPSPATTSTCGPLSIICRGYKPGTAPGICGLVTNACPNGQLRDACGECGGKATDPTACEVKRKQSFPVGAVIGIIIACCVLIGGGVYIYMRRQNTRMKDDIDSLLKQYLPLEGTSSNGKPSKDPNANLRLIGNLDTSDATDL